MQPKSNKDIAKAARDTAGVEAAMRRAVASELAKRRKLGLPIVAVDDPARRNGKPSSK